MFGKMFKRFQKDHLRKTELTNHFEGKIELLREKNEKEKADEDLTNLLMNKIHQFREETKSMDYLRDEIEEAINNQPDGLNRSLKGLAEAFKK